MQASSDTFVAFLWHLRGLKRSLSLLRLWARFGLKLLMKQCFAYCKRCNRNRVLGQTNQRTRFSSNWGQFGAQTKVNFGPAFYSFFVNAANHTSLKSEGTSRSLLEYLRAFWTTRNISFISWRIFHHLNEEKVVEDRYQHWRAQTSVALLSFKLLRLLGDIDL